MLFIQKMKILPYSVCRRKLLPAAIAKAGIVFNVCLFCMSTNQKVVLKRYLVVWTRLACKCCQYVDVVCLLR